MNDTIKNDLKKLPKVMKELRQAVYGETLSTLKMLELIAKVDKSREFLHCGYSSLYNYLTFGLKYSEGAANRRIRAARILNRNSTVRTLFRERKVSLCTLSLIQDMPDLLNEISGKSKRAVEELIAFKQGKASNVKEKIIPIVVAKQVSEINLQKVIPQSNLKTENFLNSTATNSKVSTLHQNTVLASKDYLPPPELTSILDNNLNDKKILILEERFKVTFSFQKETKELIEEAKNLLSHIHPQGASFEELFVAGLKAIITNNKKQLSVKSRKSPKITATAVGGVIYKNPRYIPPIIKREIFKRDKNSCTYRHRSGEICGSKWQVEVDHIKPLVLGGKTEKENLRLLCRAHNQKLGKDISPSLR